MSIFDSVRNAAHDHPTVKNLAEKLGIDQEMAEKAIAALAAGHQADGDTVENASRESGISNDILSNVLEHIGGEGSLTGFMQILSDDHDGNVLNKVGGMFGSKE